MRDTEEITWVGPIKTKLFKLLPEALRSFDDGWYFYIAGGRLSCLNRFHWSGWHYATWDEWFQRAWKRLRGR